MSGFGGYIFSAITGYVRHVKYRTDHGQPEKEDIESYRALTQNGDPGSLQQYTSAQQRLVIERFEEFSIAHVEFDDQGQYWDSEQLQTLERDILNDPGYEGEDRGVLMVCFMHGWKNNAHFENGNLQSFRAVLHDLHETEKQLTTRLTMGRTRRIVGIYLSWRGLSNRIRFVKELTFWNRKKTAHRVGRGDLAETLSRIEQMRFHIPLASKLSRLIIIGHSFGGAAVYSAVAPYIKTVANGESQAQELDNGSYMSKIRGFGDLVVLVNPAFEALLYDSLDRLTREINAYDPTQHVVLMTVGADNDRATQRAFPLGQFLGRWYEKKQRFQFPMIKTTSANFEKYMTHELRLAESTDDAPLVNETCGPNTDVRKWSYSDNYDEGMNESAGEESPDSASDDSWQRYEPEDRRWELHGTRMDLPANHAFMLVRSRDKIIDGHNGIFEAVFMEFLRDFVIAQDLHIQDARSDDQEQAVAEAVIPQFTSKRLSGVAKKYEAL